MNGSIVLIMCVVGVVPRPAQRTHTHTHTTGPKYAAKFRPRT